MWRSFFYSIGIGLFALGLQTLVVEHVTVPKDTKFQKLVRKVLDDDKPAATRNQPAQPLPTQVQNQYASNWSTQTQTPSPRVGGYVANTNSRYGPSRFSGPAYGTGYGGARIGANPANPANRNARPLGSGQPFQYQNQFQNQYQNQFQNQLQNQFQNPNQTNAQFAAYRGTVAASGTKNVVKTQKLIIREWMPWSLLASGAIIFLYTHTHQRHRFDG